MEKLALITGASAGIGEAIALRLAGKGYGLILTARRVDRLQDVAKRCRANGAKEVFVHALDVSDLKSVEAMFAASNLKNAMSKLNVVVNNAGLARGVDKMDQAKIEDWQVMMDTNVMGLLYVTRMALPSIRANRGHVVNIGSVAGRWTYPGGGVYCATKAAVRAITEGLRMDLLGAGVRVTNIEPGMVVSDFSETRLGSKAAAEKVYENFDPLTADDIAECVEWSLSRPTRVNIQEMIVFPTNQAGVSHVHRE